MARALRGLAVLFAMALWAIGVLQLFYALLFSNSEADQIPEGAVEMVPWFLLPSIGAAGAFWALRDALLALARRGSLRRYPAAVAAAIAGQAATVAYVFFLVGS